MIDLIRHPIVVEAGPYPGVYQDEEAYRNRLRRAGIKHPLGCIPKDLSKTIVHTNPEPTTEVPVRQIETILCSEDEARDKFEEFFTRYERGGGSNLRVELVRGLPGIRFVLVGDWDGE